MCGRGSGREWEREWEGVRKRAIAVDTLTMLLCIAIHGKYTYKRESYCIDALTMLLLTTCYVSLYVVIYIYIHIYILYILIYIFIYIYI